MFGFYACRSARTTPKDSRRIRTTCGGMGAVDLRGRAASHGGGHEPATGVEVSARSSSSTAARHITSPRAGTQRRWCYQPSVRRWWRSPQAGLPGRESGLREGLRLLQLDPAPGTATIGRDVGRGPGPGDVNLRMSRTWAFGNKGESGVDNGGMPPGVGGVRGPEGWGTRRPASGRRTARRWSRAACSAPTAARSTT